MNTGKRKIRSIVEKTVLVFVLAYGLHNISYFLRIRYFNWIDSLMMSAGVAHALGYLGHTVFLAVYLLYALAVRGDRTYILGPIRRRPGLYVFFGALTGFCLMGICILAAVQNGNLSGEKTRRVSPVITDQAARPRQRARMAPARWFAGWVCEQTWKKLPGEMSDHRGAFVNPGCSVIPLPLPRQRPRKA